jgi:predicted small lipoprotein YifL
MTRLTLLFVALFGFLLTGCGQSGPLYLPGDPSEIQQAPRPAETTAESEDEDDEELTENNKQE